MTHELKIQKQWADAKLAGEKPFEIRRNDRGFQKGDVVNYSVVDPKTGDPWRGDPEPGDYVGPTVGAGPGRAHPLEQLSFRITYVTEGRDGLEKGYCVYADVPVPKAKPFVADTPEKKFYAKLAEDVANTPPVCLSAFAHAREGSAFRCSRLAEDRVHCMEERGKCEHQEKPGAPA